MRNCSSICGLILGTALICVTQALPRACAQTTKGDVLSAATDVFVAGQDGYKFYRIPALIVTRQGTLLAFCEGRKQGRGDAGDIDLVLRRSSDGGKTWGPVELVYEEGGDAAVTIGNPCPVVDGETGAIWLPFCRDNRDVLVTVSHDDGRTWAKPREITKDVKAADWSWYATGPGVGIQLREGAQRGRLVIPCDHRAQVEEQPVKFSHVFYSDDHGATWQLGGTVDQHTDECQVAELPGGELLINMRNYWGKSGGRPTRGGQRAIARSADGGATWGPIEFDAVLVEPVCQASLIAIAAKDAKQERWLAFCNPASATKRTDLTLRLSRDGGVTWPIETLIDDGSAAYSSMAALPDGRLAILYERQNYARISLVLVDLAKLSSAAGQ